MNSIYVGFILFHWNSEKGLFIYSFGNICRIHCLFWFWEMEMHSLYANPEIDKLLGLYFCRMFICEFYIKKLYLKWNIVLGQLSWKSKRLMWILWNHCKLYQIRMPHKYRVSCLKHIESFHLPASTSVWIINYASLFVTIIFYLNNTIKRPYKIDSAQ